MIIEGTFEVYAPLSAVWDQLSDLRGLAPLLPGCEAIEPADAGQYRASVVAKVGPIKARLTGMITPVETVAPERVQLRVEGVDQITGSHVRAALAFALAAPEVARTIVQYRADVAVSGRLGSIGQAILRETTGTILEEFVRRFRARIRAEPIEERGLTALTVEATTRSIKAGVASWLARQQPSK
jgi:uncharacterized protein